MRYFTVDVHSIYLCSITISAFLQSISLCIYTHILQIKHILQRGIETFHQQIGLEMADLSTQIHRSTKTIGLFRLQTFGQADQYPFSTNGGNMEVFIISLWCTETCRPSQTALNGITRLVEHIDTRTENQVVDQVMFIQTETGQKGKVVHLPFILEESTGNTHLLFQISAISRHDVVHIVVRVFHTSGKGSR